MRKTRVKFIAVDNLDEIETAINITIAELESMDNVEFTNLSIDNITRVERSIQYYHVMIQYSYIEKSKGVQV